jgi:hypothetical protein
VPSTDAATFAANVDQARGAAAFVVAAGGALLHRHAIAQLADRHGVVYLFATTVHFETCARRCAPRSS